MVLGPDVRELIDGGYLASFRYLAPSIGIDMSRVRSIGGDYNAGDLEDALNQDGITGNVIAHYQQHLAGRTAISFYVTVAHAGMWRSGSATPASLLHRLTAPCHRTSGMTW